MATSKKTTSKSKAVTEKEENALAASGIDFGDDLGGGFEGADKDSFAIPFLRVLQKGSPQVDEADAAYIEGAKPGMLFNTVTGAIYDGKEGLVFIPCAFQRRFIRWAPRGSDGGFKGEYLPEEVAEMRKDGRAVDTDDGLLIPTEDGELSGKKCDRLQDTRTHFGLIEGEEQLSQVAFPLASTQIKKSKQLMAMLQEAKVRGPKGLVTPPTWMNRVRVTTGVEQNDEGSWYGVKFTGEGFVDSQDVYDYGKSFHESISKGEAKANFAAEDEAAGTAPEGDGKF